MAIETNGRFHRKQLSDQLDRLDTMLDGLSEALNDSIAGAVRDGTRLALKDAVVEILTDPALRSKLREATEPAKAPASVTQTSFWAAAKARVAATVCALQSGAAIVVSSAAGAADSVMSAVRNPAQIAAVLRSLKHLAWVGVSAGLAIAVVSYVAPHMISAGLSGITAAAAAISIRASNWSLRSIQSVAA